MSLFSSFFVLLLVLIEASPTSASVSYLGNYIYDISFFLVLSIYFSAMDARLQTLTAYRGYM